MIEKLITCAIGAMFILNLGGILVLMAADMIQTAIEQRRWRKWARENGRGWL